MAGLVENGVSDGDVKASVIGVMRRWSKGETGDSYDVDMAKAV
jgi:hypothetical protein